MELKVCSASFSSYRISLHKKRLQWYRTWYSPWIERCFFQITNFYPFLSFPIYNSSSLGSIFHFFRKTSFFGLPITPTLKILRRSNQANDHRKEEEEHFQIVHLFPEIIHVSFQWWWYISTSFHSSHSPPPNFQVEQFKWSWNVYWERMLQNNINHSFRWLNKPNEFHLQKLFPKTFSWWPQLFHSLRERMVQIGKILFS